MACQRRHRNLAVGLLDLNVIGERHRQRTELAFCGHDIAGHFDGHPIGNLNRVASYSRHRINPQLKAWFRAAALEDLAKNLATNILGSCLGIRKHTTRRRQDRDTKTVVNAAQIAHAGINPPAWRRLR